METQFKNDHDALVTLVESVKNLRESQEKFHIEIKAKIDDLKSNYSSRIEDLESRVGKLETSKTSTTILLSIGTGLLTLLSGLLIYHIVGK